MTNKQQPKFLLYVLPTFDNILWMAAFWGVLIRGRRMMNADGDLARHLTLGRYMLDTGKIPLQDLFSHTMTGEPLTPHEWLCQVFFALAERIFGFEGVIILCALVISTTIWLVFKQARKETHTLLPAVFVALLVLINSMVHWLARPHIFTFLMLTLWMLTLDQLLEGKLKRWWMLPILMLFWANLHGAFIAGFVTWLIYGVATAWDALLQKNTNEAHLSPKFWRYYLLGGFTSFAVTLLNPSGFRLWKTSVGYLGENYLVNHTYEYMSPNFHEVTFWPFLLYIGLLIFVMGLSNKKPKSTILFNAIAWLLMGLYSARNIPLFAIVSASLLVSGLDDLILQNVSRNKLVKSFHDLDNRVKIIEKELRGFFWPVISILIAIIGLAMGFMFDSEGKGYAFDSEVFPVDAVDWLEENPQEGEMFNYFTWGGYLLYRLWPEEQVFIDAQTDFYGEALTRQYMQVMNEEDSWGNELDQYGVTWAILPPSEPAVHAIQSDLNWELVYKDKTAVILRRP